MALKSTGTLLYRLVRVSKCSFYQQCQDVTRKHLFASLTCSSVAKVCFPRQATTRLFSSQAESTTEDERLYSLISVKVKGSDEAVLKSYTHFVTRAANLLNIDISGRIVLPTRKERYTLLKSPHIYKKHRAQYEIRTHGRMLQLKNLTCNTADVFLEYIQRNLPEGVSMSVEQTALEPMPEYLQPPQAALDFLKSQQQNTATETQTST
ncbi:28S ribosomal protein S10, mitochondrial [Nematostella vectensis]|uniref:28S ribosomal protein S10, mitochondrial n=1 Tax=Nematostella vectensis TaxID=45351 RepID=UPI00139020D2|nr:28S ribosomal protein S10, mitochondrial [Nematostella vectensis]